MPSPWADYLKTLDPKVDYTATGQQPGTIPGAPRPPSTATLDPVQLQRTLPELEEAWRAQFGEFSPYGRQLAERLGPPWPGGRWDWQDIEGEVPYGYWDPRLQRVHLRPEPPEGYTLGRVALHELGHAVQSARWGQAEPKRFVSDIAQGWGGGWEGGSPDPWELYAQYAEQPWYIPEHLDPWFPQYPIGRPRG